MPCRISLGLDSPLPYHGPQQLAQQLGLRLQTKQLPEQKQLVFPVAWYWLPLLSVLQRLAWQLQRMALAGGQAAQQPLHLPLEVPCPAACQPPLSA